MNLMGYTEAAEFLGMKKSTLYALVSQRRVPHVRLGSRSVRFERARLEEWVTTCTVEPEVDKHEPTSDDA